MTDKYQRIREALEAGPTPGPWRWEKDRFNDGFSGLYSGDEPVIVPQCRNDGDDGAAWFGVDEYYYGETALREADSTLIAACDPDTIRELLEERDMLTRELSTERALSFRDQVSALEAECERLKKNADRWHFVSQFMELDDVGDDQFALGLTVYGESIAEKAAPFAGRLYTEWRQAQHANCSEENPDPDDSIPAPTVDDVIDAVIASAVGSKA